jgi:hypothetical protein
MNFEDLERIFPIVDIPSAQLMKVKARCLHDAGVITAAQKIIIDHRANAALASAAVGERDESEALMDLAMGANHAHHSDAMQRNEVECSNRTSAPQHRRPSYTTAL